MDGNDANRELAAAEAEVESACALLMQVTVAGLDECEHTLARAAERLRTALACVGDNRGDPASLAAATSVRLAIGRASRLLEAAGDYHLQWMRRLETMFNGYTPEGQPVPLDGGRLLLRG